MNITELYKQNIAQHGKNVQLLVTIETMIGMIKEISRYLQNFGNKTKILERIVDVKMMVEQLEVIFDSYDVLYEVRNYKLNRLARSLGLEGTFGSDNKK